MGQESGSGPGMSPRGEILGRKKIKTQKFFLEKMTIYGFLLDFLFNAPVFHSIYRWHVQLFTPVDLESWCPSLWCVTRLRLTFQSANVRKRAGAGGWSAVSQSGAVFRHLDQWDDWLATTLAQSVVTCCKNSDVYLCIPTSVVIARDGAVTLIWWW